MSNNIDTLGIATTGASIASAVAGEVIRYHPLQLWAWIVAIASGVVAITLGCIRIYQTLTQGRRDE
jgi:membrane-associated phospholipid phosphatase